MAEANQEIVTILKREIPSQPEVKEALARVEGVRKVLKAQEARLISCQTEKRLLEEQITLDKREMENAYSETDPIELNRLICGKEQELEGISKRIEALSKGGEAYLSAKKNLDEARERLRNAIHKAVCQISPKIASLMNDALEKGVAVVNGWKSGVSAVYGEFGEVDLTGSTHSLPIDQMRTDHIFREQFL
ncbi:MAG: hypothetical protein ACYDEQ_02180 [Desulfocucumaceae bacterium]